MTQDRICELDLPAGSLQCALYAFKGGADAIYLGMKSFSARKGAVNFSFDDVRKVKAYCLEHGKKYYITLNTLVTDAELPAIDRLLRQLDYLAPDGVIVQDLGIAKLIRDRYPDLPLHGSTQLAVHTIDGVKELQRLGFSRVVLSRELSFDEIKAIREACPDVELKVFVHGALCYGFSGICMASQFMTAGTAEGVRSANRGSCAQICRSWFHCDETGTDSWLFSMKDLCLGEKVRQFASIGVDSLKIEGRMKGPDYAYWCARYYRLLLDGHDEREDEVKWAKEAMQVSFSRETTDYFFSTGTRGSTGCAPMVSPEDPGHKGVLVGTVDKVLGSKAVVRFSKPVAIRDGLKVVSGGHSESFSLTRIEDLSGSMKSFISEGETATVNFPSSGFSKKPGFGTPVYCISRHNLNMGLLNENIPMYKKPVDLDIVLDNGLMSVNGMVFKLDVQEARNQSDSSQILSKTFGASDKSLFTLGKLTVSDNTGFGSVFIPMSALKQARRDFYEALDAAFMKEQEAPVELETLMVRDPSLPPRTALGLWDRTVEVSGKRYLPLSPVMFNEKEYLEGIDRMIAADPELVVGLNNIAQVLWAKQHPGTRFFADVFLYTENSYSYSLLKEELPNLSASYELDRDTPFNYTGDDYTPPLFISRVCMRHNSLGLPCMGCSRDNTFHLEQNGKHYKAWCVDCITVVTKQ